MCGHFPFACEPKSLGFSSHFVSHTGIRQGGETHTNSLPLGEARMRQFFLFLTVADNMSSGKNIPEALL